MIIKMGIGLRIALVITLGIYTESIETVPKCHYVAWKRETLCDPVVPVQTQKHFHHQNSIPKIEEESRIVEPKKPFIFSCDPSHKKIFSTLPKNGRAMSMFSSKVEASDEFASHWWNCTVPVTKKFSPPQPGKSTLVFVHVPKVGGTSLEAVFDRLTEIRKPLCSRRFMDSFDKKPVAIHKANSIHGCMKNVSNLLWGHLSLDIEGAAAITANPMNGFNPPPLFSMMLLRDPLERLVSFANYMGISKTEFEESWAKQMSANTMTSMINGLKPLGVLNRNRFSGEPLSCMKNPQLAVAEAKARLLHTFTFIGTTELYEASLWMLQRIFGWGESIILDSLLHPRQGFRTKHATQQHIIAFKPNDVEENIKTFVIKKESCDGLIHDFGTELLKSRLRTMSREDHYLFREFERKLQIGGSV